MLFFELHPLKQRNLELPMHVSHFRSDFQSSIYLINLTLIFSGELDSCLSAQSGTVTK